MTHTTDIRPWTVKRIGKQCYVEEVNSKGRGGFICDMQLPEAMEEDVDAVLETARLIAAAPALYAALKTLLFNVHHGNGAAAWEESKERADAALAQADGEEAPCSPPSA